MSTGFPPFTNFLEVALTFVDLEVVYGVVIVAWVFVIGDGGAQMAEDGGGRVTVGGGTVILDDGVKKKQVMV